MRVKEIDLLDIADGAIREKIADHLAELYENLMDENCPPMMKRKIKVEMSFEPFDERRREFKVGVTTSVILASPKGIVTSVTFERSGDGVVAVELGSQERGQLDLYGGEVEEKVIPIKRAK